MTAFQHVEHPVHVLRCKKWHRCNRVRNVLDLLGGLARWPAGSPTLFRTGMISTGFSGPNKAVEHGLCWHALCRIHDRQRALAGERIRDTFVVGNRRAPGCRLAQNELVATRNRQYRQGTDCP